MIYVQHLLGIGHLMRARVIAEALADAGFAVHLVSGGTAIGGRMPRNVDVVQLPPIRVSDASFNPLRDADFVPIDEAYREARRARLLAAYDAARPDAVLFETFPFGRRQLRFELVPLLERIDATRPRPLVVSSVREILQVQPKPEREREMKEWAARWFDAVLVHGDPRFARFEETYPLAGTLAPPVHYTGFVLTPGPADTTPVPRDEVVISAGGGGVGIQHLANALAAQRLSRHGHLTWRVLAGPNITDEGYRSLMAGAAPTAIVERSRADFQALLRRALVSVSQGGYNTVLDVLSSGARPVIVPFTGNGETEQRERGERLARLGVALVLDDRTLTPQALADAVDAAVSRTSFARFDFDCDGAAGTAAFFLRALDGERPAGRRAEAS
jgi:predicted glycosyltransferase